MAYGITIGTMDTGIAITKYIMSIIDILYTQILDTNVGILNCEIFEKKLFEFSF